MKKKKAKRRGRPELPPADRREVFPLRLPASLIARAESLGNSAALIERLLRRELCEPPTINIDGRIYSVPTGAFAYKRGTKPLEWVYDRSVKAVPYESALPDSIVLIQFSDYYEISSIDRFGLLHVVYSPGPHPYATEAEIVEEWRAQQRDGKLEGTGHRLTWTNAHGQRCAIAL